MATCKVKSFTMTFGQWNLSWPGRLWKTTTIRLPVKFTLVLDEGSTKSDCLIRQLLRGRVEMHGRVSDDFVAWTADGGLGQPYWWDGSHWYGGDGDWSWLEEKATFRDETGFNGVELAAYPLYWGGVARAGHFQYKTYVKDKASGVVLKELTWGMLINVRSPDKGGLYTKACTEDGEIVQFRA
jgi:hypothetical protein